MIPPVRRQLLILAVFVGLASPLGWAKSPERYRIWTDVSGKHTVRAKLLDSSGGMAHLEIDGRVKLIPLVKLSAADKRYVASRFSAMELTGDVVGITDGDTLTLLDDAQVQIKIRLEGIDAPESAQDFGSRSRQALAKLVFGKPVRIEWRAKDKYGRTLGHVFSDGVWVNRQLLRDGMAWHYKEYNQMAVLADAEREARAAQTGLWSIAAPTPPWEFRHAKQLARGPPATDDEEFAESFFQAARKLDPPATPVRRTPYGTAEIARDTTDKTVHVGGYYRADGTYVRGHWRRAPGGGSDRALGITSPARKSYSSSSSSSGGTVHVKGYYRKDGTYVRPHTRRR